MSASRCPLSLWRSSSAEDEEENSDTTEMLTLSAAAAEAEAAEAGQAHSDAAHACADNGVMATSVDVALRTPRLHLISSTLEHMVAVQRFTLAVSISLLALVLLLLALLSRGLGWADAISAAAAAPPYPSVSPPVHLLSDHDTRPPPAVAPLMDTRVPSAELVSVPAPVYPPVGDVCPDGCAATTYYTPVRDAALWSVSRAGEPAGPSPLTPAQAFGPNRAVRYLEAPPATGRFNNQRLLLGAALLMARLLQRVLVLRQDLVQHIDYLRLAALHPVVFVHELPALVSRDNLPFDGNTVLYLSRADFERDPKQQAWFNSAGAGLQPRFLLDECGDGSLLGDKELLSFQFPFPKLRSWFAGFPPDMWSSMQLWLVDALRLTPEVYYIAGVARNAAHARNAAEPLPPPLPDYATQAAAAAATAALNSTTIALRNSSYASRSSVKSVSNARLSSLSCEGFDASIHLRTGDYLNVGSDFNQYVRSVSATSAAVVAQLRAAGWTDPAAVRRPLVYVASEPHPLVDQLVQQLQSSGLEAWTWQDVRARAELRGLHGWPMLDDGNRVGQVEVLLLASSRIFLPAPLSTLSEFALQLRQSSPVHRADALIATLQWDTLMEADGSDRSQPLNKVTIFPPDTPAEALTQQQWNTLKPAPAPADEAARRVWHTFINLNHTS